MNVESLPLPGFGRLREATRRFRMGPLHAPAAPTPQQVIDRQVLLERLRALRVHLQARFAQAAEERHAAHPADLLRLLRCLELALRLDELVLLPALREADAAPHRALVAVEIDIEVLRDLALLYEHEPEMLGSSARLHFRTMDLLLRSPAAQRNVNWTRARRDVEAMLEGWRESEPGVDDETTTGDPAGLPHR